MKRLGCLILAICIIAVSLAGCGAKRELFNVKLEDYVTLTDCHSIVVDRTSTEYQAYYERIFESYVANASAYDKITDGTVKDGDTVNIDYTGKKDGVAFEGGTATGQNLVIGSKSFIDGFESGLIGKKVGSTVDLNLTFPTDYSQKDLAGKAVVFTVKINYVQALPEKNDETAKKLGFENKDKMLADIDVNSIKNTMAQNIIANSSVNKYSDKDKEKYDKYYDEFIAYYQEYTANYNKQYGTNVSLDEVLYYTVGGTASDVKSNITSEMETYMILYAALDAEGLTVTEEDINKTVESMTNANTSAAQVRENYDSWRLEALTVEGLVINHYYENVITVK